MATLAGLLDGRCVDRGRAVTGLAEETGNLGGRLVVFRVGLENFRLICLFSGGLTVAGDTVAGGTVVALVFLPSGVQAFFFLSILAGDVRIASDRTKEHGDWLCFDFSFKPENEVNTV